MPIKPIWIVLAVAGMLGYLAIAVLADREALQVGIGTLGVGGLAAVLLLSLVNYGLRFLRWHWYLLKCGREVPLIQDMLYYTAGFAFTVTPGKAGEAVRSLYLRKHGVEYSESLALLFVERFLDLAAILILASFYAIVEPAYRPLAAVSALVMGVVFVTVATGHMAQVVRAVGRRLPPKLASICEHIANMFAQSRSMLAPNRLAFALTIGVVAWAAEGYGLCLLANALGIGVNVIEGNAVYAGAILAGTLAFFMPGGIGGTELVMTALLVQHGAAQSVAVVATVICRAATLWFAVVLGMLAILVLHNQASPQQTPAQP